MNTLRLEVGCWCNVVEQDRVVGHALIVDGGGSELLVDFFRPGQSDPYDRHWVNRDRTRTWIAYRTAVDMQNAWRELKSQQAPAPVTARVSRR